VRFASSSGNLYAGILRRPSAVGTRDILRTNNYLGAAIMTLLATRDRIDQPYVEAETVNLPGLPSPADRVFVGNEDRALMRPPTGTGVGQSATIDVSQNAATTPPSGFAHLQIEHRVTLRNGPPVRPAVHPDGTIYAVLYHWTNFTTFATVDVVVVRDDEWGTSAQPFQALIDPGDNIAGMRVVTGRSLPFDSNQGIFGQERHVGSNFEHCSRSQKQQCRLHCMG
jgi:hypothetical protein